MGKTVEKIRNILIKYELFSIISDYVGDVTYIKYDKDSEVVISIAFMGDGAKTMFNRIKAIYKK